MPEAHSAGSIVILALSAILIACVCGLMLDHLLHGGSLGVLGNAGLILFGLVLFWGVSPQRGAMIYASQAMGACVLSASTVTLMLMLRRRIRILLWQNGRAGRQAQRSAGGE